MLPGEWVCVCSALSLASRASSRSIWLRSAVDEIGLVRQAITASGPPSSARYSCSSWANWSSSMFAIHTASSLSVLSSYSLRACSRSAISLGVAFRPPRSGPKRYTRARSGSPGQTGCNLASTTPPVPSSARLGCGRICFEAAQALRSSSRWRRLRSRTSGESAVDHADLGVGDAVDRGAASSVSRQGPRLGSGRAADASAQVDGTFSRKAPGRPREAPPEPAAPTARSAG